MNDNVIITSKHKTDRQRYHTDVCRQVWQLSRKRYVDEAEAQRRGYEECAYCAGEFEPGTADNTVYQMALEIGKERAGAD